MTKIYYERDGELEELAGKSIAVVGYGNQGRSWALNLRDSGLDVRVCARADESREHAQEDGFAVHDLSEASDADIACVLIPDDVIPSLPITRSEDQLTIVASGYTFAFDRFKPPGDLSMVAPRMLGPEVRRCYLEKQGFITALSVERDVTGRALARTLAIAKAIGGLQQGAIELSPMQEAVLDLAVEQVLSPALTHVSGSFVRVMLEQGIPLEAVLTELFLSGEVERTYRLLREEGFAAQLEHHSPTSQYGQLSRRGSYDSLDFVPLMQKIVEEIRSGRFADAWDEEQRTNYKHLEQLKEAHAGAAIQAMEEDLRRRLGPDAEA